MPVRRLAASGGFFDTSFNREDENVSSCAPDVPRCQRCAAKGGCAQRHPIHTTRSCNPELQPGTSQGLSSRSFRVTVELSVAVKEVLPPTMLLQHPAVTLHEPDGHRYHRGIQPQPCITSCLPWLAHCIFGGPFCLLECVSDLRILSLSCLICRSTLFRASLSSGVLLAFDRSLSRSLTSWSR